MTLNRNGSSEQSGLFSNGQTAVAEQPHTRVSEHNLSLAYLRAFIIILVVLHHSALGYFVPNAPSPAASLAANLNSVWALSPVIDTHVSELLQLVVFFNDRFFMMLLFFLSGLFVWRSLQRKGKLMFFRDRLVRLGVPFLVMVVLSPFVFYATYLQSSTLGQPPFWHQWFSLDRWPVGPAWFVWLLLVFDAIAVFLLSLPRGTSLFERIPAIIVQRPAALFWLLVTASAVSYFPMIAFFDPNFAWWTWGPFSFQLSRVFLYLVYFLTGVALGASGVERTFLVHDSMLSRRWRIWVIAAVLTFIINIAITFSKTNQGSSALVAITLLLFCTTACFAFLALFLRFAVHRNRFFESLFRNSYGIYVVHYVVVSWLLYAMLRVSFPGTAKGIIVFICSVVVSWGLVFIIRRIPGVSRAL